jgi:hypothetical protein
MASKGKPSAGIQKTPRTMDPAPMIMDPPEDTNSTDDPPEDPESTDDDEGWENALSSLKKNEIRNLVTEFDQEEDRKKQNGEKQIEKDKKW